MPFSFSLIVLAAGKGTRYGGNKQFAEVGPDGQCLFEYSLFDAVRAGFDHVVFVVDVLDKQNEILQRLERYGFSIRIDFVVQGLTSGIDYFESARVSSERKKPWGTAHALLMCEQAIDNPFVTINADDYYGRNNFSIIADYLARSVCDPVQSAALPGYRLANTLSKTGGVNRGICTLDKHSYLESVYEVENIRELENTGIEKTVRLSFDVPQAAPFDSRDVTSDSVVSMNLWGFQPEIFKLLRDAFQGFLALKGESLTAEIYIPQVVDEAVKSGNLKVRVLPTSDSWKGITYPEDLAEVQKFILQQTATGHYPDPIC